MLVGTWLKGIGLQYAVENFEAAGIVTPESLAELSVSHFEALGISSPDDRRKLFYLVQRIKMAVVDKKDETIDEVEAVLADSFSPKVPAKTEHDYDDDGTAATADEEQSSAEKAAKENKNLNKKTSSKVVAPIEVEIKAKDAEDDYDMTDDEEDDLDAAIEEVLEGDDSDWEEEDEEPLASSVTARRTSRRLQQKGDRLSLDSTASTSSRTSSLARPSTGRLSTSSLSRPPRSSIDSSRRLSGVPKPKSSRMAEAQPRSMRTGKQLSSIPAHAVAPMSPLVELPKASSLTRGRSTKTRPTSMDGGGGSSSVSSSSDSERRGRHSLLETRSASYDDDDNDDDNGHWRSHSSSSAPRTLRGQSLGAAVRKHPARRTHSNQERSPTRLIRRPAEDDSFKAQIEGLREDALADYELFGGTEVNLDDEEDMRIRVVVRKRPMSKHEIAAAGDVDILHPLDYGTFGRVLVYQPKTRVDLTKAIETTTFAFDNVFDETSTNMQLYERSVRHLIPSLFEGQWASVFAYGQTGAGKTFTMMGANMTGLKDSGPKNVNEENLGLYYMAALDIFHAINQAGFADFSVSLSLFEIYGGKLFDLLNERSCVKCLENSKGRVCFPGLTEHSILNADELLELIELGAANRSTGCTSRNADSSRSHAVLQLHLNKAGARGRDDEFSRLTFIDLAGSERGADTSSASRATRMEGAEINTSLLALKEVIRALATGDSLTHVPFRGSKLTQVLKESFVGANCRSVMIACASPNIGNCEQTLNTLRYADRVKERNPGTGMPAITPRNANGSRRHSTAKFFSKAEASTKIEDDGGEADGAANGISTSFASDVLDEILASSPPRHVRAPQKQVVEEGTDPRAVAQELISSHKEAMSAMLAMVKDEMALVNQADSDRENLDSYITKLNEIQEKQLFFIVTMREHLLQYHTANGGNEAAAALDGHSDEESFEDLRD